MIDKKTLKDFEMSKTRISFSTKDVFGKSVKVNYDPYLFGLIYSLVNRRHKNWHALILITGEVGDGKSTLGDGIGGLDAYLTKKKYGLDNNVFSTQKFEEFCDQSDNFLEPLKYDEAIEGATNQDMARSSKGLSFKKKIIQKRKKKHLYIMCIDELEEYSWKLIKMADAWIHVKSFGLQRGYFDMTLDTSKIKSKYLALKNKQYHLAKKIYPDRMNCTFMNFENIFIDDDKYQEKKDEETKSQKPKDEKEKRNEWIANALRQGKMTQSEIANVFGLSQSSVREVKSKISSK